MSDLIIEEVVSQHAEEAAFLWLTRDSAVRAPHFSLRQLTALDERVEAHIDGVRIAGDAGWDICSAAMETGDAGEVFAAAVVAFESERHSRLDKVCEHGSISIENSRALISALGWIPYERAQTHIEWFLASESPILRRVGIGGAAAHRNNPGQPLITALSDAHPALRARALRAVGELGLLELEPRVREQLAAEELECHFWAAWSSSLLTKDSAALTALRKTVETGGCLAEMAVRMIPAVMDLDSANSWLRSLTSPRAALIGFGALGDPDNIGRVLTHMQTPELARVAGEALSTITGVDFGRERLAGECPEGFESGPTESPADENVETDPDEDVIWPNVQLVEKWWSAHSSMFNGGTRYLIGQPINRERLEQVLRTGLQRQRAAAAFELAVLEPTRALFEVRAPGVRQELALRP